jgi:hypothetical protein
LLHDAFGLVLMQTARIRPDAKKFATLTGVSALISCGALLSAIAFSIQHGIAKREYEALWEQPALKRLKDSPGSAAPLPTEEIRDGLRRIHESAYRRAIALIISGGSGVLASRLLLARALAHRKACRPR